MQSRPRNAHKLSVALPQLVRVLGRRSERDTLLLLLLVSVLLLFFVLLLVLLSVHICT
jgi:hypothetical protein